MRKSNHPIPLSKRRPKGTPRPAPRPTLCAFEFEWEAIIVADGDDLVWRIAVELLVEEPIMVVVLGDDVVRKLVEVKWLVVVRVPCA